MNKMMLASAAALCSFSIAPAYADVIQVSASDIQGAEVLFNTGDQQGNVVTGHLNNSPTTLVDFQGSDNAILRASGGQAKVTGALDESTNNPNDTIELNGFIFDLADGGTFNNAEFNLFGGSATSANFAVVDDGGQTFNFSGDLGNGSNFFGFKGINGQSIRSITVATVGGGINDVRQVRLDLNEAIVPEPATWALMLGGFGLVGAASRRRARSAAMSC